VFDFHMHSKVSFDGKADAKDMVQAAVAAGLREICFTDHLDYDPKGLLQDCTFDTHVYNETYDDLHHPDVIIRRGAEFGMLPDNRDTFLEDLKRRHFDFIIGSVHFAGGVDIYLPEFWEGRTVEESERCCLEETLACVQAHDGFDVLGHITYAGKARANPVHRPVPYDAHQDIVDEILRTLARKGIGIEINTSGMDVCGAYLPAPEYLRRFKELGGEIVTVGSDAHNALRVGQYCRDACRMVADIFGYVCTFADRKPVFHKL